MRSLSALLFTAPTLAQWWKHPHVPPGRSPTHHEERPECRFAPSYKQERILANPNDFIHDLLYWEGQFIQPSIGYNPANGMTYDGQLLNYSTGLPLEASRGQHNFSAASKESLHIMVLAQVLSGNELAAQYLSPGKPWMAEEKAFSLMAQKLYTYLAFNQTYPGFGGLLPWYNDTASNPLSPTSDWVNRLPALDNGELLWAGYAVVQALSTHTNPRYRGLASEWQVWLNYSASTAARLFYLGDGKVCAVTSLNQTLSPTDPTQIYTCEEGDEGSPGLLDDPYEGELFTWWLYFFSPDLHQADREALWTTKRPKLQSVEYASSRLLSAITVQKGYWFSAHEQWKLLEMPYTSIPLVNRIYANAERVRTCNSFSKGIPGMYASVNNVTDLTTGDVEGYISNTGVPSVSFLPEQELVVVTPYSTFPAMLFNRSVGLAWYHNMLLGRKMQNLFGSSEGERIDGTGMSSFVSWDTKVTTVVALLGGVGDLVKQKMEQDGIYGEFVAVTDREYGRLFKELKGEELEMCLPSVEIPDSLQDYMTCSVKPQAH